MQSSRKPKIRRLTNPKLPIQEPIPNIIYFWERVGRTIKITAPLMQCISVGMTSEEEMGNIRNEIARLLYRLATVGEDAFDEINSFLTVFLGHPFAKTDGATIRHQEAILDGISFNLTFERVNQLGLGIAFLMRKFPGVQVPYIYAAYVFSNLVKIGTNIMRDLPEAKEAIAIMDVMVSRGLAIQVDLAAAAALWLQAEALSFTFMNMFIGMIRKTNAGDYLARGCQASIFLFSHILLDRTRATYWDDYLGSLFLLAPPGPLPVAIDGIVYEELGNVMAANHVMTERGVASLKEGEELRILDMVRHVGSADDSDSTLFNEVANYIGDNIPANITISKYMSSQDLNLKNMLDTAFATAISTLTKSIEKNQSAYTISATLASLQVLVDTLDRKDIREIKDLLLGIVGVLPDNSRYAAASWVAKHHGTFCEGLYLHGSEFIHHIFEEEMKIYSGNFTALTDTSPLYKLSEKFKETFSDTRPDIDFEAAIGWINEHMTPQLLLTIAADFTIGLNWVRPLLLIIFVVMHTPVKESSWLDWGANIIGESIFVGGFSWLVTRGGFITNPYMAVGITSQAMHAVRWHNKQRLLEWALSATKDSDWWATAFERTQSVSLFSNDTLKGIVTNIKDDHGVRDNDSKWKPRFTEDTPNTDSIDDFIKYKAIADHLNEQQGDTQDSKPTVAASLRLLLAAILALIDYIYGKLTWTTVIPPNKIIIDGLILYIKTKYNTKDAATNAAIQLQTNFFEKYLALVHMHWLNSLMETSSQVMLRNPIMDLRDLAGKKRTSAPTYRPFKQGVVMVTDHPAQHIVVHCTSDKPALAKEDREYIDEALKDNKYTIELEIHATGTFSFAAVLWNYLDTKFRTPTTLTIKRAFSSKTGFLKTLYLIKKIKCVRLHYLGHANITAAITTIAKWWNYGNMPEITVHDYLVDLLPKFKTTETAHELLFYEGIMNVTVGVMDVVLHIPKVFNKNGWHPILDINAHLGSPKTGSRVGQTNPGDVFGYSENIIGQFQAGITPFVENRITSGFHETDASKLSTLKIVLPHEYMTFSTRFRVVFSDSRQLSSLKIKLRHNGYDVTTINTTISLMNTLVHLDLPFTETPMTIDLSVLTKLKFAAYRPLVPNSPTNLKINEIVNVDEPQDKVRLLLRVERPRNPTWAWTKITADRAFQQAYTMERGTPYATMSCNEFPPNEASSIYTSTPYLVASRVAKWIVPRAVNYGIGALATHAASYALGGQVDTGAVGFTTISSIYLARRLLTYANYIADIKGIAPIRRWNGMTGEEGPTWWDTAMATTYRALGVGTVGLGVAAGLTRVMGNQAPVYIMTHTLAQAALAIPLSGFATTVADATIGILTVRNPTNIKQPTRVNNEHPTDIDQDAKKQKQNPSNSVQFEKQLVVG